MRWVRRAGLAGLALAALSAGAQARKIQEYRLHEQEDRGTPFGMTVGPDDTLYTLIPRRDGNWVLSEVKGWWQDHPNEVGILVEGYSARDAATSFGQMDLGVSADGKYLITTISAGFKGAPDDPYPMDMIVETVRLDGFEVVDTEHMRALGMRGMLVGGMDRTDKLLVRSSVETAGTAGAPYVSWFVVDVPEEKAQMECSYQAAPDGKDTQPMEDGCGGFAKQEGYGSAAEMDGKVWPAGGAASPAAPPGVAIASKDRFQTREVTVDGKKLTLVVVNGVNIEVYAAE